MSFGMQSYDFHEFERYRQQKLNDTYNKRCIINSFDCICDLVYFKYSVKTDFDSHHDVKVMKLNPYTEYLHIISIF